MSTELPSFVPSSGRKRPTRADVKKVNGETRHPDSPGIPRLSVEQRAISSSASGSDSKDQVLQRPVIRLRERPRVSGIAADDAEPQAWRIGSESADEQMPKRSLLPTTADQPAENLPPSFAPGRKHRVGRNSASSEHRQTANPPAYTPDRTMSKRGEFTHAPRTQESRQRGMSTTTSSVQRFQPRLQSTNALSSKASLRHPVVPKKRSAHWGHKLVSLVVALLVLIVAWGAFLVWDANSHLGRTNALTSGASTPGTTYLLAGSDSRADGAVQDGFDENDRSDTIMLIHVAQNGQATALSIPRDSYVEIPDYGWDKINASFAYGGANLLTQTVENLTGLHVDHYVQVGMGGVANIVNAVGGINVCFDGDVSDDPSGLVWQAGCSDVDGMTALAFSRMRYSDPKGDIGRAERQRQVISKVIDKSASIGTFVNPARTLRLERAGSESFTVDEDSSVVDVAKLVLAFRSASNNGLIGAPPIDEINYQTDMGTSAVLLEGTTAPDFFEKLRSGTLSTEDFNIFNG